MEPLRTADFARFEGIFEPSAILQLADGRFLIAEDEKEQPLSLFGFDAAGRARVVALQPGRGVDGEDYRKLNDLEGLAHDRSGWIYAITSHSRNRRGEEKPSREQLLRFRVEAERIVELQSARGLKRALCAAHPLLAAAAAEADAKGGKGFNIEGLEVSPQDGRLLVGLRSPLQEGRAIVAAVENLDAIFARGEAPRVAGGLLTLDLGGHGIRGISWLPARDAFLVVAGPAGLEVEDCRLWCWSGGPTSLPLAVSAEGLAGFGRAEGVSPATIGGRSGILVVADDGDRLAPRGARWIFVPLERLRFGA